MGGGGGSSQTQTTTTAPLESQQPFIQGVLNRAQGTLGRSFVGDQPLVAGTNQNIEAGQEAALAAAQQQQQIGAQQAGLIGRLAETGTAQDPLLQRRLADVASLQQRNLAENILPSIRTGSALAGQTGSSRQGIAEGLAARGAIEATARAQTGLLSDAARQQLEATQAALRLSPQAQAAQLTGAQTIGQVGTQQRGIEQQLLQEPLLRQQAERDRLGSLSSIVSQQTSPFGTQTTTTEEAGGGGFGGALGAIGGGLIGAKFGGLDGAKFGAGLGSQLGGALI